MPSILTHLTQVLAKAADTNPDAGRPPVCILWPDGDKHWLPALSLLREQLPQLYTFGTYQPDHKQGPAAWLRCIVAGTLKNFPLHSTPILYLPGVTRTMLRGVEDCNLLHKPLVELQYRGAYWSQESHRDWTPMALLTNRKDGLGLEVSRDGDTKLELSRCLPQILDLDVSELEGQYIDASNLRALVLDQDPVRLLLRYIDGGDEYLAKTSMEQRGALIAEMKDVYAINLEAMGHLGAVEAFGKRTGKWRSVFERYAEAPTQYPHIEHHLRRVNITRDMFWLEEFGNHDGWPQWNDEHENKLRSSLKTLVDVSTVDCLKGLNELAKVHARRCDLVWAKLGKAPLAYALLSLTELGQQAQIMLPDTSFDVLAKAYENEGFLTDATALQAMSCVDSTEDCEVVEALVRKLYEPWLSASAKTLQTLVKRDKYPGSEVNSLSQQATTWPNGTCIYFIDGLRYDVGIRLMRLLQNAGHEIQESSAVWSALPSVTATAKPAVSPVASEIDGGPPSETFEPRIKATGMSLTSARFKALLRQAGWQTLSETETGDTEGLAWTEIKDLDDVGHRNRSDFALSIDKVLYDVQRRIADLIGAGWHQIRIVTDHGWLYLPGGLPKQHLDTALSESRWGRSAALKEGSSNAGLYQVPWAWNALVDFVVPDGIQCYKSGQQYSHGGLSLQECLTLHFTIVGADTERSDGLGFTVSWVRQKCLVVIDGDPAGLQFDVRRLPADPTSTVLLSPKPAGNDGTVNLWVELELDETAVPLFVVALDNKGDLRAQQATTSPS